MRVLAVSGSLQERLPQHPPPPGGSAAAAARGGTRALWRAQADPSVRRGRRGHAAREIKEWRAAIEAADAVLFATPEYNPSIPGQLKNALDWASRPKSEAALLNKPVAVVGASKSMFGGLWAQAELRKVLSASGARVLDAELAVATAHEAFDEDSLIDAELSDALGAVVEDLIDLARNVRNRRS